jgi:hypothetical protein
MNLILLAVAAVVTASVVLLAVFMEIRALSRDSRVDDAQRFPRVLHSQDAASKNTRV